MENRLNGVILSSYQYKRIRELKEKLRETDYIARKFIESVMRYILSDNGDKTEILALYNEYKETIDNAPTWRDEINVLEEELKTLKGE